MKVFTSTCTDQITITSKVQNNEVLVTIDLFNEGESFFVFLDRKSSFELGQQLIEQSKELKPEITQEQNETLICKGKCDHGYNDEYGNELYCSIKDKN